MRRMLPKTPTSKPSAPESAVPKRGPGAPITITPERWNKFFEVMIDSAGNTNKACFECKISFEHVRYMRDKDPVFAARYDAAKRTGLEVLEDEVTRRAHDGIEKGVYFMGQRIAVERNYSDALAVFLLKSGNPEKFAERTRVEINRTDTRKLADATEEELEALINKKKRD